MKYEFTRNAVNIDVNILIAFCHIIDNYDNFKENLNLFSYENNSESINFTVLEKLSEKQPVLLNSKLKYFYYMNKRVIDTIKKYCSISNFICNLEKVEDMYSYINKNRKKIDEILSVLNRVKKLGFTRIYFDHNANFDNIVYDFSASFSHLDLYFMDGVISVLPSRNMSLINYYSKESNYLMSLDWSFDKISKYNREIVLNNLLFDVNNLPETISYESIIQPLKDMKEKNRETDQFIANSVYLNNSLEAMSEIITRIDEIVEKIGETDNKEKALAIISKTKDSVKEMNKFLSQYESQGKRKHAVKKNLLEEEKTKYKTYLRDSAIDLC